MLVLDNEFFCMEKYTLYFLGRNVRKWIWFEVQMLIPIIVYQKLGIHHKVLVDLRVKRRHDSCFIDVFYCKIYMFPFKTTVKLRRN